MRSITLLLAITLYSICKVESFPAPGSINSENMSRRGPTDVGDAIKTGVSGWLQKTITITAPSRGCHVITSEITRQIPELQRFSVGIAHIFIKHTSASLTINENADPDVRTDMESALNKIVPESWHRDLFTHVMEGPDDMAGHVKSSLMGSSVSIPISNGRLSLGTWQGIYLCEHRDSGGWSGGHARNITITINGLVAT